MYTASELPSIIIVAFAFPRSAADFIDFYAESSFLFLSLALIEPPCNKNVFSLAAVADTAALWLTGGCIAP